MLVFSAVFNVLFRSGSGCDLPRKKEGEGEKKIERESIKEGFQNLYTHIDFKFCRADAR